MGLLPGRGGAPDRSKLSNKGLVLLVLFPRATAHLPSSGQRTGQMREEAAARSQRVVLVQQAAATASSSQRGEPSFHFHGTTGGTEEGHDDVSSLLQAGGMASSGVALRNCLPY